VITINAIQDIMHIVANNQENFKIILLTLLFDWHWIKRYSTMLKVVAWFGGHLSPTSVSGCVRIPRCYSLLNQRKNKFSYYFIPSMRVTRSVGQLGQGIRKLTGIHMAPTHRVSSYEASEGKVPDISAVLGDLDMPEIDQDLETYQEETGAVFLDVSCAQPIRFTIELQGPRWAVK